VTTGAVRTVSSAAVVSTRPATLVNTARNRCPSSAPVVAGVVYVVAVAPAMSVNVLPPSVERCHCTDGVGWPSAAAVNTACWPASTVRSCGCVVTAGPAVTVRVAAEVVVVPAVLVNTAR
jgi:hypothetical protein